jgi:glycosyltransferase involved in cell wall biosynthesis
MARPDAFGLVHPALAAEGPCAGAPRRARGGGGTVWLQTAAARAARRAGADAFFGSLGILPLLSSLPGVATVHDLTPLLFPEWHSPKNRLGFNPFIGATVRRARRIVAVSDATRRDLVAAFPDAAPKTVVVHNGVEPEAPAVLDPAPHGGRPYVLYVGTLEPRKNLAALVEAWREVRRHHPVELVLAGRRRSDFAALAKEPGLRIMGEVPDEALPQLYSGALAFVYPSLYEGFGLPVLEAMQCGACVIASRAVAEAAGDAAVYADTPQELARAMREAAARPEWRAELGARSLARAREFSWERTARMTHQVYEEARRRFGR